MTSRLVDHLRALSDAGLGELVQLRPDLVVPVPSDLSALASRAQGRVSVARALDGLDQFALEILDGLRFVRSDDGTAAVETLLTLTAEAGVDPARVRTALDELRSRALIIGSDAAIQLVSAVEELTSPYPAGLGRPAADLDPAAAELAADAAGLRRTLLSAPPEARAVLDRLAAGPPVGTVQAATIAADSGSPVRWLVDHHLLVVVADDMVELPREVGLVLRRDTGPLGHLHPDPPELDSPVRPGADSAGAGQALEAVRHLDALLQALADNPAPVLRTFGLGIRDLRRLARDAGTGEADSALLLEVAYAAGLLGYTEPGSRGTGARPAGPAEMLWLPAPAYDTWRGGELADRWALLARTWLDMSRAPSLIGQRDEKDRPISALSAEVNRATAAAARRSVLSVLADAPPGMAVGLDGAQARLAWRSPRRAGAASAGQQALTRAILIEAATLGVTSLDALTTYGRVLLAEASTLGRRRPAGGAGGSGSRRRRAGHCPRRPTAGPGRPHARAGRSDGGRPRPTGRDARRRTGGRGRRRVPGRRDRLPGDTGQHPPRVGHGLLGGRRASVVPTAVPHATAADARVSRR